jgi:DNA adenine methylase
MTTTQIMSKYSSRQCLPFAVFPATKFMGSKQRILPFIMQHVSGLRFRNVLDAFSGSGCVAYAFKRLGAQVHTNDFLAFAYHTARATVENNATRMIENDVQKLLKTNKNAGSFIQDTFRSLYFSDEDNRFLDNLWANIQELKSPLKRSLALAAACRAAMKKRPRGIFTFTGKKGWDGRKDLRLTMKDQFLSAISQFNNAVWSNGKENKAMCGDVFDIDPRKYDLVYIDTPYISPYSDCDYTRRYHFVEGFCTYWEDQEIAEDTKTRKIRSYPTAFGRRGDAFNAFNRLFHHFRNSILVVSYSSNGIPSKQEMVRLLRENKKSVQVWKTSHTYSFGNHGHKVGNNKNSVEEYLFIAN